MGGLACGGQALSGEDATRTSPAMDEVGCADSVADYDSPWKEALDRFFPEFMALIFPEVHCRIDWNVAPIFMDKELQQVTRDAESGRSHADKLISVRMNDGTETWVLLHVEIQGKTTIEFKARMFRYYYRLRDRYPERKIASFAVLTKARNARTTMLYRDACLGCEVSLKFPVACLGNWNDAARWEHLEHSENPFALVVMAQLQAHRFKGGEARKQAKLRLIRLMLQRGLARETIMELFRLIDWMLQLPAVLELQFEHEMSQMEQENAMAYITSVERIRVARARQEGLSEGQKEGLREGLREGQKEGALTIVRRLFAKKFGPLPSWVEEKLAQADKEQLEAWSEQFINADKIEDFLH